MSTNFLLSNPGVAQPVLTAQQSNIPRTRAISVCSNPNPPARAQYPSNFSQSYPPISAIDAWNSVQPGLYVNGVGKVVNVFPGRPISDLDDIHLGQSCESYKYTNMKLSGVNPQTGGHLYSQPQSSYQGANQPGNPATQMQFALAAASNGLAQHQNPMNPMANSLRADPTSMLPSPGSQQNSAPGQPLFVPGIVGQQTFQSQGPASPSVFHELSRVNNGVRAIKPVPSATDSQSTRVVVSNIPSSVAHANYPPTMQLAQHLGLSHQFYSASAVQHPPPPHISPALQHNVIEFIPSMFPTELNPQASFTQPPTAMFGHFPAPQVSSSYEASTVAFDGQFTRVRHNTWAGLGSDLIAQPSKPQQQTSDTTLALREVDPGNLPPARVPADQCASSYSQVYNSQEATMYSASHRPNMLEFVPSSTMSDHNPQQLGRDFNLYGITNNTNGNNTASKLGDKNPQWSSHAIYPSNQSRTDNCIQYSLPMPNNGLYEDAYGLGSLTIHGCPTQRLAFPKDGLKCERGPAERHFSGAQSNRFGHPRSSRMPQLPVSSVKKPGHLVRDPARTRGGFANKALQPSPALPSNFNPTTSTTTPPALFKPQWPPSSAVFHNNTMISPDHPSVQQSVHPTWQRPLLPLLSPHPYSFAKVSPFGGSHGSTDFQQRPFAQARSAWNIHQEPRELRAVLDMCPMRVLISTALVGAVIGRGGRTIRSITAESGALIEFKPLTLAFCQFSLPSGVRHASHSSAPTVTTSTTTTTVEDASETPGTTTAAAVATPTSPGPTDPRDQQQHQQYSRSQVLFISGTREQCSAALAEILVVCFRESEHKGLADPCLGLLVQNPIYNLLLLNRGRAYFNAIRAATGVRITVTGPNVCSPMDNAQPGSDRPPSKSAMDPTGDRILVVHGPLRTICAAEVFISEELRFATAEFLLSPTIWRLIPLLPLDALMTSITRLKLGPRWAQELQNVNKVVLDVAEVFWPHSVYSRLVKHPSFLDSFQEAVCSLFQLGVPDSGRRSKTTAALLPPTNQSQDTVPTDEEHPTTEPVDTMEQKPEQEGCLLSSDKPAPTDAVPSSTSDHSLASNLQASAATAPVTSSSSCQPHDRVPTDGLDSPSSSCSVTSAAVQQAVLTLLGSATWLATSGMLYMRVSYNDAGILIGSGGCRIQQLIQSTGALIHVNKTPISEPYALVQARRQLQPDSTPAATQSHQCDEPEVTCPDLPIDDQEDAEIEPSCTEEVVPSSPPDLAADTAIHDGSSPVADEEPPSCNANGHDDSVSEAGSTTQPSAFNEVAESNNQPSTGDNQRANNATCNTSYRLVTLSGSYQSQLLALWRIFQRLKFVHDRGGLGEPTGRLTKPTESEPAESRSQASAPFRLATLVCLPYLFAYWLTSNHPKFAALMPKSPRDPPEGSVSSSSTPLQWLQSQTCWQTSPEDGVTVHAIHLLPEPRRRRRLVRQQLRRATANRRDGGTKGGFKPIVLPAVGLTHDGLDALWSDPNCVPLEIYADYETTQITLGHLHHMLTLWLYGQTLISPMHADLIPQPQPFINDPQYYGLRSIDASTRFPRLIDWSANGQWPPNGLLATARAPAHPRFGTAYGGPALQPYAPGDAYGRSPRAPRLPFYTTRWPPAPLENSRAPSFPTNMDHHTTMFHPRPMPAALTHQSFHSAWPHRLHLVRNDPSLMASSFSRLPVSDFHTPPRFSNGSFVWDYSSFLNRPTQPPRRQAAGGGTNRQTRRQIPAASVPPVQPPPPGGDSVDPVVASSKAEEDIPSSA